MQFRFQGRPGLATWLTILAVLALLTAIGIAFAIVAVGVFLILLPAMTIAALAYYLYLRIKFRGGPKKKPGAPDIIDGEFRVVDRSEGTSSGPEN